MNRVRLCDQNLRFFNCSLIVTKAPVAETDAFVFVILRNCFLYQLLFLRVSCLWGGRGGESEARENVVDACGYAVVAEVADATGVGVADVSVGFVFPFLHLHADCLVGIAEGHAFKSKPVHILYREEVVVFRIIENPGVHPDVSEHEFRHFEAGDDFRCCRECHVFQQLEIAVVTQREVRGKKGDLVGQ